MRAPPGFRRVVVVECASCHIRHPYTAISGAELKEVILADRWVLSGRVWFCPVCAAFIKH